MKKLLAIGEALIDFIPDRKNCAFDEVGAFSPKVGGAPANVCGAFAALGGKAALLSALGQDPFGDVIQKELMRFGVDTAYVKRSDKANTALAFVSLAADGNRTFSFYRNPSADMLFSPQDLTPAAFENAYALHFCSVSLGDFPMKEAHRAAIRMADEEGALISFDPNLRFPLWKDAQKLYEAVWEFIPQAQILKVSDEELPFLCPASSTEKALEALFVGKVKLLLYTKGKEGASLYFKQNGVLKGLHCEGIESACVDTTGAGDAFIGAFLYKLSQSALASRLISPSAEIAQEDGDALGKALAFANRFAAASTEHYGALPSYAEAARTLRDAT